MTLREFYLQRRKAELPGFLKILKALPKDQIQYKPSDRSPTAEQIVWTLTHELKACIDSVTEKEAHGMTDPPPSMDKMMEMYERWYQQLIDVVSKMDDSEWNSKAKFYFKEKMVSELPIGDFLWMILFDAIHHRGQLSAYIRPMGGKVPGVYGGSGDEAPAQT